MARKKSGIDWSSCPRCGGRYRKISGFFMCQGCGHKSDTVIISDASFGCGKASGHSYRYAKPKIEDEENNRSISHLEGSGKRYDHGIKFKE